MTRTLSKLVLVTVTKVIASHLLRLSRHRKKGLVTIAHVIKPEPQQIMIAAIAPWLQVAAASDYLPVTPHGLRESESRQRIDSDSPSRDVVHATDAAVLVTCWSRQC